MEQHCIHRVGYTFRFNNPMSGCQRSTLVHHLASQPDQRKIRSSQSSHRSHKQTCLPAHRKKAHKPSNARHMTAGSCDPCCSKAEIHPWIVGQKIYILRPRTVQMKFFAVAEIRSGSLCYYTARVRNARAGLHRLSAIHGLHWQ